MKDNWTEEILGKNAYIKGRIGWRGLKASEYKKDGPFLIAGNHINNGRVDWTRCDHISQYRYEESWEIALKEKDIILTKDGTIGRIALIDKLQGQATINSTMMLIRVNPPLVPEFIYHYLNSASFQKIIDDRVSGSSIPHIFQEDMKRLKIRIPLEVEQLQIARILDTLDEAIQKTEQLIAKLKAIKQGLLHDLLTRGLDENGQLRDPVAHPEQFKDSPLGRIPKEWEVNRLSHCLAMIRNGTTQEQTDEITIFPVTRIETISEEIINWNKVAFLKKDAPLFKMYKGDILYSHINSLEHVGKVAIYLDDRKLYHGMNLMLLRFNDLLLPKFGYYMLSSYFGRVHARRESKRAINQVSLSRNQISAFTFGRPPINEQKFITEILSAQDVAIQKENSFFDKLRLLKKGLMHDLLTGRVRVNIQSEEQKHENSHHS